MGERLFFGFGRALWLNLVVGFLTSLTVAIVIASMIAHEGEEGGSAVLFLGPMIGVACGFLAGLVHGVVQLPLVAMNASRAVRATVATALSVVLVVSLVLLGSDEPLWNPALVLFTPYVLLSPLFAGSPQNDPRSPADAKYDAASDGSRRT
jgi:glucose-6-phosphate-specific signal transduction histidine kinase